MKSSDNLRIAFYGDDFTGSTDAMEFLSRAGLKTVLFMHPPSLEQLKQYEEPDAIGISGITRAMIPEEMKKELKHAFTLLRDLNIPHIHYKVCSTFDSSPEIGSIGKAIDVGAEIFESEFIPLVVAAPALGRYCVFGNLFARMGIGSEGSIYRLDRHPSMKLHPVTPSDESDLRIHLSRQTSKKIGLIDILQITLDENQTERVLNSLILEGAEVVLFDALYESHMSSIGHLIDRCANRGKSLFSVGSSGVEMALGSHWKSQGMLETEQVWESPGRAEPLLVASGSRSPITTGQIARAITGGFADIALDTATIAREDGNLSGIIDKHADKAVKYINEGRSVILHSSLGDNDQRVAETEKVFKNRGWDTFAVRTNSSKLFGTALGKIVREIISQTSVQRVVFAGGDTSGYASGALGIEAVEMIAPISPGAPLCKVYALNSPAHGIEVNFKGGQVGREDYFEMVLEGKTI